MVAPVRNVLPPNECRRISVPPQAGQRGRPTQITTKTNKIQNEKSKFTQQS